MRTRTNHSTWRGVFFLILIGNLPISGDLIAQQKFHFSQYMSNGLVLNPACAGTAEALVLTLYNRNQWNGIEGAPSTQSLSAHTLFGHQHVGLGLALSNDKIGVHKNFRAALSGAYHLKVSARGFLSMGLQVEYGNRKSDYISLASNTVPDYKISNAGLSQNSLNMGFGFYFRSPTAEVGLSAPEVLTEKIDVNDSTTLIFQQKNYFLFGRLRLKVSQHVQFEPSILLKYFENVPLSIDLNAGLLFHKIIFAGVSYRKDESIGLLARFDITPQLQVGYGFDYPVGEIKTITGPSHEFMLGYLFKFSRQNVVSPR